MNTSILSSIYKEIVYPFIEFVYPPVCFHCGEIVQAQEILCTLCEASMQFIHHDSSLHTELRMHFKKNMTPIKDVYAYYAFQQEGPLQTLVHNLKYMQKPSIGTYLGNKLGVEINERYGVDKSWTLIPVPLFPTKERHRGYNQTYYIAKGIAQKTDAVINIKSLRRIRNTPSQTKLTLEERKSNVSDAFECNIKYLQNHKNIAIVDDIITTGATISECARTIVHATEKPIYAFSVGYAV